MVIVGDLCRAISSGVGNRSQQRGVKMVWHPTPKHRRITATRLNPATGEWFACEYSELRAGDIIRTFAADGTQVDPCTLDLVENEDIVAYCHADATKARPPYNPTSEGWMVEMTSGTPDEVMRLVTN